MGETDIANLFYAPVEQSRSMGDYLVFGSAVPQYMIRVRQPKVCPACLREAGYARKIWDLSPVTACPIHMCLLLDECPNCAKPISWRRFKINYCRCEFDWRECQTITVGVSELEVAHRIHLLCNLPTCVIRRNHSANTSLLNNLDLKHFLSALFFVASQYAGVIDTKGKHLAPSVRNADLHVLLCKAWKVFESWPNNYFDFLGWRRLQMAASSSVRGLRRDFAEYKSALYKQLAAPELDFMRTAFEEYLIEHWDGGYTAHVKRLNGIANDTGKYVSRKEANALLRVGVQSIDKFIAIGKLKAIIKRQDKSRLILIERVSLLELKHELDQSLYLKQVQGLLGLSHRRVLELVNCDLLNPLREPTVDGCRDWKFSEKEVKDLLCQIKRTVRANESVRNVDTISFFMAFRRLRGAQVLMGQFIKDIVAGEICPLRVSLKPGLNAFQFSKKKIAEYGNNRLQARQ